MEILKHVILLVMYIVKKVQKILKKIRKTKELKVKNSAARAMDTKKVAAYDDK